MMFTTRHSRKTRFVDLAIALTLVGVAVPTRAQQQASASPPTAAAATTPEKATSNYWVYVGAESAVPARRVFCARDNCRSVDRRDPGRHIFRNLAIRCRAVWCNDAWTDLPRRSGPGAARPEAFV